MFSPVETFVTLGTDCLRGIRIFYGKGVLWAISYPISCLSTFEAYSFCFYYCHKFLSHECNLVLYGSYILDCHNPHIVVLLSETLAG